jgi:uncharacterized protein (DUF2252 family)
VTVRKRSDAALDPKRLAERQIAIDHERFNPGGRESDPIGRRPLGADERARAAIVAEAKRRKVARMHRSPLAFLRGSAPLFYEMLTLVPDLGDGPLGKGWLVGDLHVENFGAFEPGPWKGPKEFEPPVFDLNDFDETLVGPLRWDSLRFVTSLLLGSRELGTTGVESIDLARIFFESYTDTLFDARMLPARPGAVRRLLADVKRRQEGDALAGYVDPSGERLAHGTKLLELGPRLRSLVPAAFEAYRASLPEDERPKSAHMELLDCAFRLAGTGSLGCLRVVILARGKKSPWLFDMKSQEGPSGAGLARAERVDPVERVMSGQRACVEHTPLLVGRTTLDGVSMLVRKLTEEEDKLDLPGVPKDELPELVGYLGALVGRAHARSMTERGLAHRWTRGDTEAILDTAVELAGVHEAAYLAYSKATEGHG